MKLPNISNKNGHNVKDSFLAIDITDTSVKTLLVDSTKAPFTVKGVAVRSLDDSNKDQMSATIAHSVRETFVQADMQTSNAIIGMGGPNVFGFMLIVKVKRKNPEALITDKELDGYYSKIKDIATKQADEMWNVFHANSVNLVPLDLVVNSFEIDEGKIEDPIGKASSFIQISVYCSYSEMNFYSSILDVLSQSKINPNAVTTTLYSQVKLLSEKHKNYILIDIGKSYTDLAVVFGKDIVQTKSFQIGGDYFTNYLANRLGLEFKKAQGKKESFSLNTVADDEVDRLRDILYDAGVDWRTGLSSALRTMVGIKSFPHKLILSGGGANMSTIQDLLLDESWRNTIPFSDKLEVDRVESSLWSEVIDDELKVISGAGMFVPASICAVKLELSKIN